MRWGVPGFVLCCLALLTYLPPPPRTHTPHASSPSPLPGIGPKVAACVALFSLDKHDSIPVDTHVWQLALR